MQINANYSVNGVPYDNKRKQKNIPQFSTECAVQENENINQYMAEPLVYVCDCYQKFNVVTGMNLFPILRNVVLPCVPIGQVSIRHPEPMKQIIHKS